VTVSKTVNGDTRDFYKERTDSSGVVYGMTLPAPDKALAAYPSAPPPSAAYDVTVEHPKYVTAKYKNCRVYDGAETVQSCELIPKIPGLDKPDPFTCVDSDSTKREKTDPAEDGKSNGEHGVKPPMYMPEDDSYYYGATHDAPKVDDTDADTLRRQLNRVSSNYPAIPKLADDGGGFDDAAQKSVAAFQQIFGLPVSGSADQATREKLGSIYDAVRELSKAYSEGITIGELERLFSGELKRGSRGKPVQIMQYFLSFISRFNKALPELTADGIFGAETEAAVRVFQRAYGLAEDGIVGRETWDTLLKAYGSVLGALPDEYRSYSSLYYPGYFISKGASGKVVEQLQTYLNKIARHRPGVPEVEIDGSYGPQTEGAVSAVQRLAGIPVTGEVGPMTWNAVVGMYNEYR